MYGTVQGTVQNLACYAWYGRVDISFYCSVQFIGHVACFMDLRPRFG